MKKIVLEKKSEHEEVEVGVYPPVGHTTDGSYPMTVELVSSEANMAEGYPESVSCRAFKVKHIKDLLYAPDDEHYAKVCARVVNEVIDYDAAELTVLDFDHVVLFLRIQSCGSESSYVVTCPECENASPIIVDLTKMDVVSLPKDFTEPKKIGNLSLILPRLKTRIEFNSLTDLTDLDAHAQYIYEGNSIEEKISLLDEADPEILKEISEFIKGTAGCGVKAVFDFTCKQEADGKICGAKRSLHIPFRSEFFLPEYT